MTTAVEQWWNLVQRGGRIVKLDPAECRELAQSKKVGRLAYQTERGPRVVPMNFVWSDDAIYIRTAASSEPAIFSVDHAVAFEIDEVDDFLESGWSVLVCGTARSQHLAAPGQLPQPWPEGQHPHVLRIATELITGRRVHPT